MIPGDSRSFEGTWERLSQVAVKSAEYDSPERQPHPKCLEGTRVTLLNHIRDVLDGRENNRIIWLHGTAGVGKSAVAFTVAEMMRSLKVTEQTRLEKRLAGTFFFSRKHTKRYTTGYFFVTLVYQLASNFPSIQEDVNEAIRRNPALLDPDKSLHDQMQSLFVQPLRRLHLRLRECPPLVFVVDALDECRPETIPDLISLLGQALREPDLPVTHVLLTSRSEEHIRRAICKEEIHSLVCEIPVNTFGEGAAATISLDGVDVDNDIYIYLQHSFRELESRHPDFPQPTADELARLASRAGRRFIVASTIINFIDDQDSDPRDRLQLMLNLTSEMLPGTEVYKLYDCIFSTCADPKRAYLHLSVVAALADPLPISEISKLLGPGQGNDFETALVQLRSVVDIPTDSSLPVNIYHSSVRDYVSDPSNCNIPQVQHITSPHSILARSSLRLMIHDIPDSTALLDALLELKRQNQAMQPRDTRSLKTSLSFIIQPLQPLQVIIILLWLRGDRSPDLQFWLETLDGRAYLQTDDGKDWLQNQGGENWLQTLSGGDWLRTQEGQFWLQTPGGKDWLQKQSGRQWLQTQGGKDWLETGRGKDWLHTRGVKGWLWTQSGRDWLQTRVGQDWLWSKRNYWRLGWLRNAEGLKTEDGRQYWSFKGMQQWSKTRFRPDGWRLGSLVHLPLLASIYEMLWAVKMGEWWLHIAILVELLVWLGYSWLICSHWLPSLQSMIMICLMQLDICFRNPLTRSKLQRLEIILVSLIRLLLLLAQTLTLMLLLLLLLTLVLMPLALPVLPSQLLFEIRVQNLLMLLLLMMMMLLLLLSSPLLVDVYFQYLLQTLGVREWLVVLAWLVRSGWLVGLQGQVGQEWLRNQGWQEWLQTQGGQEWLQTQVGQHWLQARGGREWLQTQRGQDWLQTQIGRDWLQTLSGRGWLQTLSGRDWLQTQSGRDWLQTQSGQDWLQMPHGREWQSTLAASVWMTMEEFSSTLEAISEYAMIPELPLMPTFQVIEEFKSLPDFLMFPAFLALWHQDTSASALSQGHSPPDIDMDIVRAMKAFESFANETRERSRATSDALKYACQNWAVHLSRAPTPWDDTLNHIFKSFWNRHLLSWLERLWCLKDLRSCLVILSEGEKLAKQHVLQAHGSSQSRI